MRRSKGFRSKTRRKLKRNTRHRITITERLKELKVGQRVALVLNPTAHKGMPHPRYFGKSGNVLCKRGKAYLVEIRDGRKQKVLIAKPEHIKVL